MLILGWKIGQLCVFNHRCVEALERIKGDDWKGIIAADEKQKQRARKLKAVVSRPDILIKETSIHLCAPLAVAAVPFPAPLDGHD